MDVLLVDSEPSILDVARSVLAGRADRLSVASNVSEAVAMLETVVKNHPDDPRRFQWQMDIGHDILYKLAEPYFNNILFSGAHYF